MRIKERTTSSYCTVEMLLKSLFKHIFLENEKLVNDVHNLWYHAHVLINVVEVLELFIKSIVENTIHYVIVHMRKHPLGVILHIDEKAPQ